MRRLTAHSKCRHQTCRKSTQAFLRCVQRVGDVNQLAKGRIVSYRGFDIADELPRPLERLGRVGRCVVGITGGSPGAALDTEVVLLVQRELATVALPVCLPVDGARPTPVMTMESSRRSPWLADTDEHVEVGRVELRLSLDGLQEVGLEPPAP